MRRAETAGGWLEWKTADSDYWKDTKNEVQKVQYMISESEKNPRTGVYILYNTSLIMCAYA